MNFLINFQTDNQRTSTILKNIIWGTGIKGISIIISLILVPITINYVTSELYGIWLTLSSVIGWLSFFDIGFGLGLRNRLTTALANKSLNLGKAYVSTTYCVLSLIFGCILVGGYIAAGFINWCSLLNVNSLYQDTLIATSRIVIVSFCINIVLKIFQNVLQAYQMTAVSSALDTLGQICSLIFIYTLTKITIPDLRNIAFAFCVSPIIVYIIASFICYLGKFKGVAPSINYFQKSRARDIFSLGSQFFLIQIICILLYQATNFIISYYCGPEQVTVYNIAYKYLYCSLMVFNIVMSPLWSAYNDAYAKGDYEWMLTIYTKLLRINAFVIILILIMIILSPIIYRIWVGEVVNIPIIASILVGLYMVFQSISNMHASILNGMGKVKLQIIQALVQGVIYVPLVNYLAGKFQLIGILCALLFVTIIPAILLPIQINKLLNKKDYGLWSK